MELGGGDCGGGSGDEGAGGGIGDAGGGGYGKVFEVFVLVEVAVLLSLVKYGDVKTGGDVVNYHCFCNVDLYIDCNCWSRLQ